MEKLLDKELNKNTIDLTGERFSKLLVLELDHKKQVTYDNGRKRVFYYWRCKCDCGNEVVRSGNSLRNGYTKSCGCNQVNEQKATRKKQKMLQIKHNTNGIDLTGMRFSKLVVLGLDHKEQSYYGSQGRKRTYCYWKCKCDCGNEVVRLGDSLRRGATKSCGCHKFQEQMLSMKRNKLLQNEEEFE